MIYLEYVLKEDGSREYPDGSKEWIVNGLLHRLTGHALYDSDPWNWTSNKSWFIYSIKIKESSYNDVLRLMQYVKSSVGVAQ
jgi:hypothetical protein